MTTRLAKEAPTRSDPLGDILVGKGQLRPAELQRVAAMLKPGQSLAGLLTRMGLVAETDVADGLSSLLGLPVLAADKYPDGAIGDNRLSSRFLKRAGVVPIEENDERVVLAMADPREQFSQDAVAVACGKRIVACLGLRSDIDAAIERCYGSGRSALDQLVEDAGPGAAESDADAERLKDLASEAPVVRLVNLLIQRAVNSRASDIHIEPFDDCLTIRYRVDGVLREAEAPPARLTAAVISRIKLMAKLNIAERRLPQDGRILLRVDGREIDLRVSCVPTITGESVSLRILDRESLNLDFGTLGLDDHVGRSFQALLDRPHGIILVTGPTGSGKTTTLYAALARLNTPERKILTVEDPVEYHLRGINQIQVKPRIGLTFANALRSILRQDPDAIMIGEMRDLETAQIAVQSALTGHIVLSTLHTNDAPGGITRLLEMGIDDYLVSSTVIAILAQRLVRTLCPECRIPYDPRPEVLAELQIPAAAAGHTHRLYRQSGCESCEGTGYRGRTALLELLVIDDAVRALILGHAEASEVRRLACAAGMRTMYQDGMQKALAGLTTAEEVLRVTRDA